MTRSSSPSPPPVVNPGGTGSLGLGGGIAPNLDPFANAPAGQEGAALDNSLNGIGSTGLWDSTQGTRYPKVYWGTTEDKAPDFVGPASKTKDLVLSLQDSINQYSQWSPAFRESIAQKMYLAGLITNPRNWDSVTAAWSTVVNDAGVRYAMSGGKDKVTPYDMLDIMVGVGSDLTKHAAKTTHQSNTSFSSNVIDRGTADSLIKSIYHDQIGRDPSQSELSAYRVLITGYTKDNPTKTVNNVTQVDDGNGNITQTSNSNSTGGWSQAGVQDQIQTKARANPEYGAYQAATTYYNALQELIANGH